MAKLQRYEIQLYDGVRSAVYSLKSQPISKKKRTKKQCLDLKNIE